MKLLTGKKDSFVIEGTFKELSSLAALPGAVYFVKEGRIRMPANTASYKALRDVKFNRRSVPAVNLLKRLGDEYSGKRRAIRRASRRFKHKAETSIPVPLLSNPFKHQVLAFGFASSIPSSALFMDQGTGKTLVAIAVASYRYQRGEIKRLLVITPKAVKGVWPREFKKHSPLEISVGIDTTPDTNGLEVWITNYDRVHSDIARLRKWKPDMVILDESHRIKTRDSQRTKACIAVGAKAKFKMILTGTPMGKCISEVWSQFKFIDPNVFGTQYTQFKSRYLKMGGYMQKQVVGYNNEDEFSDKMHSIAFRCTKAECLDLPPLTYQRLYVESDAKTRKIYESMKLELYSEIGDTEVTASTNAVKSMKLRQIVGGAVRADNEDLAHVSNLKVSTLSEFLADRTDDKTVVFFSFTHEIELAVKVCKKLRVAHRVLQGSTPEKERSTFESWFQECDGGAVALINIQCGAEGLTLHAADTSVYYSPTFSSIGYSQSRDRIYRIGQERPATVVFIIMENTIDNHIVDVLESNRQLVEDFLDNKRTYTLEK